MLGGILASKFGAKIILFIAVLVSSIISIISPLMARLHVAIFISIRALLGFTQVKELFFKYINYIYIFLILGCYISCYAFSFIWMGASNGKRFFF
jgi:hypothetical protein